MKRFAAIALCASLSASCLAAGKAAPGAASGAAFDVLEYDVVGNTVLPNLPIERAVYPYLGKDKHIADVEKARAALEQAYHEAGYATVFVDIPEQSVSSGVVRLKVSEGRVEKVRVMGSHFYSQGRILARAPELARGSVPYFPAVQREMAALNRLPDRRVTPILRPGRTPGTVDVDLKVKDELPLHGSLELNDYYSPNTSRLRLSGALRYDNLWQRGHSFGLQYQTSPEDTSEVRTLSLSYVLPMPDSSRSAAFYYLRSRSNVAALGDLTVLGQGDIYGARYIIPLPSGTRYFHSLTLGADYKDFTQNIEVPGATPIDTPIRYMPFSLSYNGTLQDAGGITRLGVGLSFAVRGGVDRDIDCYGQTVNQFECSRYDAKSSYFVLKPSLERTQTMPLEMSLYGKVDGQLASGPLISNEQFPAGGAASVRGYLEAEAVGDDGIHGTLELSTPSLAGKSMPKLNDLHLSAFLDGAYLRVREPLPGQQSRFSLSSAGLGLRLRAYERVNFRADLAWPFHTTAYTVAGNSRFSFRWWYEF